MSPLLALLIWFVLLVVLLFLDPAREGKVSVALWIPVVWMFIVATRLPSQWLAGGIGLAAAGGLEDGNPIDRDVYCFLILLAIGVLISRRFRWDGFFTNNLALTAFVCLALVSVCWSDFPFVSFKRWFRDLGNYLVILVALSDSRTQAPIPTLLRRLCYLLIPLSVVLIKYYPSISIQYNYWTGSSMWVGPTTSKNSLGVVCLVSGLFFVWDTLTRWQDRKKGRIKLVILVNIGFLAMTLWLLHFANSATSRICLLIGCLVIAAAHTGLVRRRPDSAQSIDPSGIMLVSHSGLWV